MIKIKLSLLLAFITLQVNAQNDTEIAENIRTKNKISERWVFEIDIKTKDSLLTGKDFYNRKGKHTTAVKYNKDGEIRNRRSMEYNSKELMDKLTLYNKSDSISTILIYEYDKNGNRIAYKGFDPNKILLRHSKIVYNGKNMQTKRYNKQKNKDTFYLNREYFYNENEQRTKIKEYNPNGRLIRIYDDEYDENGNIIAAYVTINGIKELNRVSQFNDENLPIEIIFHHRNYTVHYKYDGKNNLIEENTFQNDGLIKIIKYHYIKAF